MIGNDDIELTLGRQGKEVIESIVFEVILFFHR